MEKKYPVFLQVFPLQRYVEQCEAKIQFVRKKVWLFRCAK